jgi:hypothetical protein
MSASEAGSDIDEYADWELALEVPSHQLDRWFSLLKESTVFPIYWYVFTLGEICANFTEYVSDLWIYSLTPEFLNGFRCLLIPNIIYFPNTTHAVLYEYWLWFDTCYIYDSCGFKPNGEVYTGVLRQCENVIENIARYLKKPLPKLECVKCEQQAFGSLDCGVYVAIWAYLLLSNFEVHDYEDFFDGKSGWVRCNGNTVEYYKISVEYWRSEIPKILMRGFVEPLK